MSSNILYKKLPPNMQNDVWIDFMNAVEEESKRMQDKIYEKSLIYDLYNASYDQLIEMSILLGVPVDVSVNGTQEFLINELKSIPFRIKWKATTQLYLSFFPAIDRIGSLFLYYWNGNSLVRHSKPLLYSISGIDPSVPYQHRSMMNFTGFLTDSFALDTGLKLDTDWALDSATAKQNTKHLAMEYFIDRLITVDSEEFLMIPEYYSYITTNMDASKKAIEVVHTGCQLTAVCDASKVYDSLGYEYTMPALKLNAVTTTHFASISAKSQLKYIQFGIGTKTNLPKSDLTGVEPTALTTRLATVAVIDDEQYLSLGYYGAVAQYMGNLINDIVIGTGDGITDTFTYTLPYVPIKPQNVKITFISNSISYSVEDDKYGNLKGTNGGGTINYSTGDVVFNTTIYKDFFAIMAEGDGTAVNFSYTPDVDYTPLKQNSVIIKYILAGTLFVAIDTPIDSSTGTISGTACTGTINYITGLVELTFTQAPPLHTNITYEYQYQKVTTPDDGSEIIAEYYFTSESVEITETGLFDAEKNLLAYATFPPVKFKDYKNHLNFAFILKTTNF